MATNTTPESTAPDPENPLGIPQAVLDAGPTGREFDADGLELEDVVPGADDDDALAAPTDDDDA